MKGRDSAALSQEKNNTYFASVLKTTINKNKFQGQSEAHMGFPGCLDTITDTNFILILRGGLSNVRCLDSCVRVCMCVCVRVCVLSLIHI